MATKPGGSPPPGGGGGQGGGGGGGGGGGTSGAITGQMEGYFRQLFNAIGIPYTALGAYNPPGNAGGPGAAFDCSGLTTWIAGTMGVTLTHHAATQYTELPHVTQANLKPGDLIFFSYGRLGAGAIDHVGVYLGNGTEIIAPTAGEKVQISGVDWAHFVGGGNLPAKAGIPAQNVPTFHQVSQFAQAAGYNLASVSSGGPPLTGGGGSSGGGAGTNAGTGPGFGGASTSRAELDYVLKGYGLDPSQFTGLIDAAIRGQWTPDEVTSHIYASPVFKNTFPGIFNNDGSLKMAPSEYLNMIYGESGFNDIAKSYGINLTRNKAGELISNDVSPTEFSFRANVFTLAKSNDAYHQSINQILKQQGQSPLSQQDWFKHVMGQSDARVENLYEAATLNAAQGLDINAKQALAAGKQIGANPLDQVDLRTVVQQATQIKAFIGPELASAGITDADLAVMQSGSDPKNLQTQLQQIIRNRQALVGLHEGSLSAVGGGLFPTTPQGL